MPTYAYRCTECLHEFDVVKRMAACNTPEDCPACLGVAQKFFTPIGISGGEWVGGKFSSQLGRTFHSAAEVDAYCEKEGLIPVSSDSREWKGLKQRSREAGDREARDEGFRDSEHRKTELKEKHRDYVAAARQVKIDEYHEEHGNENKRAVDDVEAWGTPLPEA